MPIIKTPSSCGNAPKALFIKEFNIAIATDNINYLVDHVSMDVEWDIVGEKKIKGKDAFQQELQLMTLHEIDELEIHQIITHGKEAAANGVMKMNNGTSYAFADFYKFTSAAGKAIASITSYVVKL